MGGFVSDVVAIPTTIEGGVAAAEGATTIVTGTIADVEGVVEIAMQQSTILLAIEEIFAQAMQYSTMIAEFSLIALIAAAEFKAIIDILTGTGLLFWGVIETLVGNFIPDTLDFIVTLFVFSYTWMMCLFKNIKNIQVCFFFYLLEIIGQILYLPIRIFLFLMSLIKINLYKKEEAIWEMVEYLDTIVFAKTHMHICHYPKNIREQCYNCKRLKVSTLAEHAAPFIEDIFIVVPNNLGPGISRIVKGATEVMHPFDYS